MVSGTICIEGNIGCGKSTLLEFIKLKYGESKNENWSVLVEPIESWRNVNGENLLNYLYENPARYSFTFQSYAQLTMMEQHKKKPKLMERSLYSGRYCFLETLYQLNRISKLEYSILDKWFKYLIDEREKDDPTQQFESAKTSNSVGVNIGMIIYLRCTPEKVMERINVRGRREENSISYDYIKSLHEAHENWLMKNSSSLPAPLLILDTNCDKERLIELYERTLPYIKGEKKIIESPTIISLGKKRIN